MWACSLEALLAAVHIKVGLRVGALATMLDRWQADDHFVRTAKSLGGRHAARL
jgi:hypothetical protein